MKKTELIDAVASATGQTKKATEETVNALLGVVEKSLKKGEDVEFPGFGKFTVATRAARDGVNPLTKEKIKIAASKSAKFKAGKKLKDALKN